MPGTLRQAPREGTQTASCFILGSRGEAPAGGFPVSERMLKRERVGLKRRGGLDGGEIKRERFALHHGVMNFFFARYPFLLAAAPLTVARNM